MLLSEKRRWGTTCIVQFTYACYNVNIHVKVVTVAASAGELWAQTVCIVQFTYACYNVSIHVKVVTVADSAGELWAPDDTQRSRERKMTFHNTIVCTVWISYLVLIILFHSKIINYGLCKMYSNKQGCGVIHYKESTYPINKFNTIWMQIRK